MYAIRSYYGQLGRHLGAADDRDHRPCRGVEGTRQRVELADQQRARAGDRGEARHAVGRGLGPVRGAEGVHDEDVAQRRHAPRQVLVVRSLADKETHVLQQPDLPGADATRRVEIFEQRHLAPEQLAEPRRDRSERELRVEAPLLGTTVV